MGRVVLGALIIAAYALLTAIEFRRERRNPKAAKVRALVILLLFAAVFLAPLAAMSLADPFSVAFRDVLALSVLFALLCAVGAAFAAIVMVKERSAQAHKTAAMTDCMTGLFNRRGFLQVADRLVAAQRRKGEAVSVLMFDLDHFKSINDRFGHEAGDEALRAFAMTVSGAMRGGDIIGRLGGEEFAAILPGDIDKAAIVAERVRAAFEQAGVSIAGHRMNATVSVGAAAATAGSDTVASLLSRADSALYEAKRSGRNRLMALGAGMQTQVSPRQIPLAGAAPCAA
jgi:diguanylate cyclase (GGDEF)-like protein